MENYLIVDEETNNNIKNGTNRLYRLFDSRERAIQGGDIITLKNDKQSIKVEVIRMSIFKYFKDMYNEYYNLDFKDKYSSIKEILDKTYTLYTKEEEELLGCVVFEIKLV